MERMILHSDINACYASIELLRHPELRGRPVAVGGEQELRHGIILAKDQMARAAGVPQLTPDIAALGLISGMFYGAYF